MAIKTDKKQLRVGIVGMGPIGSTLAAHLVDAGAYVVVCDIDRSKIDLIKEAGIHLERLIQKDVKFAGVCYTVEELENHNLDLIAIAVKQVFSNRSSPLSVKQSRKYRLSCVSRMV